MKKVAIGLLFLSLTLFSQSNNALYLKMKKESYNKTTKLILLSKKAKRCFLNATSKKRAKRCLKLSKNSHKDIKEIFDRIVYLFNGELPKKKIKKRFVWNENRKNEILNELTRVSRDSFIYAKCLKINDNYKDFHRCLERSGL